MACDGGQGQIRNHFFQQLQPFGVQIIESPVMFAPGYAKLRSSLTHRIENEGHYNRDRRCGTFRCFGPNGAVHHHHADLCTDELLNKRLYLFVVALGVPPFDHDIPTVEVPKSLNPRRKCRLAFRRQPTSKTDPRQFDLLRVCRDRPRSRSASEHAEKFPSQHSSLLPSRQILRPGRTL